MRTAIKKKAFRKLRRVELVELIYQLRKDNLALEKRCAMLEAQVRRYEQIDRQSLQAGDELAAKMERLSDLLEVQCRGGAVEGANDSAVRLQSQGSEIQLAADMSIDRRMGGAKTHTAGRLSRSGRD